MTSLSGACRGNKNAFAGANLGVPCSPLEGVTSLDPKDYVWSGAQPKQPQAHALPPAQPGVFAPGFHHPLGFFPAFPAWPGCATPFLPPPMAMVGGMLPWKMPLLMCQMAAQATQAAQVSQQQPAKVAEQPAAGLTTPAPPSNVPAPCPAKCDPPVMPPEASADLMNKDLLECMMEDKELRQLLEEPVDFLESLSNPSKQESVSSDNSSFTLEKSSSGTESQLVDDPFFLFDDLDFCLNESDSFPDLTEFEGLNFDFPMEEETSLPEVEAVKVPKKKRSPRGLVKKKKQDGKRSGSDMTDAALAELDMLLASTEKTKGGFKIEKKTWSDKSGLKKSPVRKVAKRQGRAH